MYGIKVIGLGNGFRGDDGVGNLVARQLLPYQSQAISISEGGLAGLNLLDEMKDTHKLILIDAVSSLSESGTIHRFTFPQDRQTFRAVVWSTSATSTHGFGLGEALTLADTLGVLPPQVVIYGIELGTVETGGPLSPKVADAIRSVTDRIALQELNFSHA
ncbi:MAG: hydrogenase maturation protease [Nitrospirales bacterium]